MAESSLGTSPSDRQIEDRLDSWKEIAAYLNRDVTTVQRWEKREGMPVHRHQHDRMGSVYASRAELEAWTRSRSLRATQDDGDKVASLSPPDTKIATAMPDRFAEIDSPEPGVEPTSVAVAPFFSRPILWSAAALLALLVVILVLYRNTRTSQQAIKSIAVLPLKNLSGDPTQDYLADGMTEALIGRLSRIHDLRVISRTSVMQLKDTKLSVPEIAKTLSVDAVVEGSVMREGNRIRVHAQLIRGATDVHFWSEEYDRELPDVLALESDVAQSITNKVQITVTGQERSRLVAARPVAPEVYESYLKGMYAYGDTKADVEKSIADFQEAIRKDATFAPAYLGLAEAYDGLGTVMVGGSPSETRPKVISAARKALELDPNLAEAHVLLASTYQKQWHWLDAEAEYKRALELNPNDATAHEGFAAWLMCQGRTDEALAWARRARELDPLGNFDRTIAWILFMAHRYDDAIREARSVLAVHPDSAGSYLTLGFALMGNGQSQEAIPVLEKSVSMVNRSPGPVGLLASAYARAGHRAEAIRLIDELKRRRETGYVPTGAFINAYLGLADYDEAFVWFERAYQEQSNILQYLKVHPFFDPVRNDPRFVDLVRRVGLEQGR